MYIYIRMSRHVKRLVLQVYAYSTIGIVYKPSIFLSRGNCSIKVT